MELKDYLPLIGVAAGWLLSEGSSFGKRAIERKRTVGKAISILYFLCLEMIQLKMAQEKFKNNTSDIKEWERLRQRSLEKYTSQSPELVKRLSETADAVGEYYPIESYHLREVLNKYSFIKDKSLEPFLHDQEAYIAALSAYETGFMAYQFQLEKILRFLAFRHSKLIWIRLRLHFWRIQRQVPKGDVVFFQQIKRKKKTAPKNRGQGSVESGGGL